MAAAALAAYQRHGDDKYLAIYRKAHEWFLGNNSLKQTLVDVRNGACCDGLETRGVNKNQGAESTLAYLWTELHKPSISQAGSAATKKPAEHGSSPWSLKLK